jgi:hypothetical protein
VPIDARPFAPYGPMKNPSGRPNSAFAAAAHRIAHGSGGVGIGTGTMTPPGRTHSRQWPPEMNSGSAGRASVGSGAGKIGNSAMITMPGTNTRASGHSDRRLWSTASTRIVATRGSSASAKRMGSAPSITGNPTSAAYGPGMSVRSPLITNSGPSDSQAITTPAATQAITSGRRMR